MRTQNIIWIFCVLILIQIGWVWFRLEKLKQKRQEVWQAQQERQLQQEAAAKEELLGVVEPEIEEKLASGGKLWFELGEGVFSGEFTLAVWGETKKPVNKIDLRLFYPSGFLELVGDEWEKEAQGTAFWSGNLVSDQDRQDPPAGGSPGTEEEKKETVGKFLVKTISFKVKKSSSAEVREAVIDFDFSKESKLDCNLWDDEGNDVLEEVSGARLNLK